MSNVIRKPGCFQTARELRAHAYQNGMMGNLIPALRAANRELESGRPVCVAVMIGLRVMRA